MKKYFFITLLAVLCLFGIGAYQYLQQHDGHLHIIFCDVGQGDAIIIKSPANKYVLIDGGPDRAVLDCLSRHLPFWERKLDLMLLTHPHADHYTGLAFVADRFSTLSFATERLINKTAGFDALVALLEKKKIPQRHVFAGDQWKFFDGVVLTILGPTEEFLQLTDPDGVITDSAESGSLITEVAYGEVSILLTGDAPVEEVVDVAEARGEPVDIFQSPHHGSKTGITKAALEILQPELVAISVGKDNKYGHPSKSVLALYREFGIPIARTDERGDVEVVSDGKGWWVID